MSREVADKWCERGILGLVLAILVFGPLATGAVRTVDFLVIQGLTMGVMVLWSLRLWVSPKPQILWTPLCWAVLAFVVLAIVRYGTAPIEYVARQQLIHILVYGFLFFAILNNLYRQESVQIISYTLIGLATAVAGYAVYQYVTGSNYVWWFEKPPLYKGRAGGTYICPNHLAGFLEMLLPLALALVLVSRGRALTRVFVGYASLVMLAGVGTTISRGGWMSCCAGLFALFGALALRRQYRFPATVLLGLLLAAGTYFFIKAEPLKRRYPMLPESGLSAVSDGAVRLDLWEAALRMWQDHVWFGVGPGHYDYLFPIYRPQSMQARPEYTHNEYLNTLADWGVVGSAIIGFGLVALFAGVAKTWKPVQRSGNELAAGLNGRFVFVLGVSCGLLALLVHSVVDFNLQIPANAILATCLMALLNSHVRFATERYWVNAGLAIKGLLTLALLAGLGCLGWQECRQGREYVWLNRAEYSHLFSPEQVALLEKAFAVEPNNFETSYRIGEAYRIQSFEGGDDYEALAQKAMIWYERGWKINPLSGANYARYGMCLDWLGRHEEAAAYFNKADELEPNSCHTAANIGWHYIQVRNYAAARIWFQRSLLLLGADNQLAASYLQICQQRLLDAASTNNMLKLP